jgi:hypothetical protein
MAGGRRRKTGETPFTGAKRPLVGTDGQETASRRTGEVAAKDAPTKSGHNQAMRPQAAGSSCRVREKRLWRFAGNKLNHLFLL